MQTQSLRAVCMFSGQGPSKAKAGKPSKAKAGKLDRWSINDACGSLEKAAHHGYPSGLVRNPLYLTRTTLLFFRSLLDELTTIHEEPVLLDLLMHTRPGSFAQDGKLRAPISNVCSSFSLCRSRNGGALFSVSRLP